MRLVVSAPTKNVLIWSVTKIENAQPIGLQKLTLYQASWNEHTDGYAYDEYGNYVPFADYYDSNIEPIKADSHSSIPLAVDYKIMSTTSTLKVGGSYKTLTLKATNSDGIEITENYSTEDFKWSCNVYNDNHEMIDLTDMVLWSPGKNFNQKKIKFPDDRTYLNQILEVHCMSGSINAVAKFELVI